MKDDTKAIVVVRLVVDGLIEVGGGDCAYVQYALTSRR